MAAAKWPQLEKEVGTVISPFGREANGGSEWLSGLSRVTQPQFVTLSDFSNPAQNL